MKGRLTGSSRVHLSAVPPGGQLSKLWGLPTGVRRWTSDVEAANAAVAQAVRVTKTVVNCMIGVCGIVRFFWGGGTGQGKRWLGSEDCRRPLPTLIVPLGSSLYYRHEVEGLDNRLPGSLCTALARFGLHSFNAVIQGGPTSPGLISGVLHNSVSSIAVCLMVCVTGK